MLHAYRILGKRAAEGPEQALHRRFRLLAIFLVLLMVNNFADSAGLIHTAQLVDFGIATIAIAISTSLLQRFVRMHVHLEAEVASRTADLALKEASFRLLIEMSPESILIESGARVTFANRTALAFFGCATAEQLTSRPMVQLVEPRARPAFEAWLRARTLVSRATSLHEASFVRLDGSIVTGELVAIELLLDGAPSVVTMIRDVSERQRMLAKLRFADRMTSLGTLSAGMAHEINNPLAAVVANVEMARKVTRSEPAPLGSSAHMELEAMLTDAAEGADRVRSIVRGLKAFSRADEETIGRVDPREVLESAIRLVQNELRHRATLVRAYEPTSPALGNAARLEQVLVNLLVNAAQAISVGAADRNAIRVVTRMDGDEWVVLEVHDSGCGIEPALKHRIFDPFFTTKAIGVGTGLGLSVCHGIVSAFGGRIEVESTRGSGSRFCVYLPAAPTAHVIAPGPPKSADIVGRLRVLIVDDETLVARALRRVLSDHEVVVASDGREALEACAVGRFNLILCDVMVPEMTGIEVYRAIARDYPGREEQIVFVSGGVFSGEANDLLEGMPNLMLEKPIGTAELTAVLRRAAVGESFRNPT